MKWSTLLAGTAVFAVLAAVGGGLAFFKYRQITAPPPPPHEQVESIEAVPARTISWNPTADLVGTVFSLRSVELSNELAGRVREVRFESGSVVNAGDALVVLDDSADQADLKAAQAAVEVAQASIASARVRIDLAQREVDRVAKAALDSAASEIEVDRKRSELDLMKAELTKWEAEVELAQARVRQVEARIAKLTIKASYRGRVGLRTVHEGQFLPEGTRLVMLEEVADRIYLDFAIPQEYLSRVNVGTSVMATSPVLGDTPVRIEVVAIDANVNNATRNVRVRAIVDNADDRLRPGMFVQIRVPVAEPTPNIVIPTTAVRRTSFGDQVFVVSKEDSGAEVARQRFVTLGPSVGNDVVVLSGVADGELVAASGSFKLRDGVKVAIRPPSKGPIGAQR